MTMSPATRPATLNVTGVVAEGVVEAAEVAGVRAWLDPPQAASRDTATPMNSADQARRVAREQLTL